MTSLLQDHEIGCSPIDHENMVLILGKHRVCLEYSQLMELLIQMSSVAAVMENSEAPIVGTKLENISFEYH